MSAVTETNKKPLLEVKGLKQYFPVSRKFTVKAVEDVSFYINPGETYGLVGESGSGKTTIGRALIRLYDPTAGQITFDGMDISGKMSRQTEARLRSDMQMIFQDPFNSLNPRMDIFRIISEPLDIHFKKMARQKKRDRVAELLETVGLKADYMARYPHEFSGGQRQRVGIARALAAGPELLLMDEPFGALDAVTRARLQDMVLELWRKQEPKKTVFFVTHDVDEAILLSTKIFVLGQSPSNVIFSCDIPSDGRPTRETQFEDPKFLNLRNTLIWAIYIRKTSKRIR